MEFSLLGAAFVGVGALYLVLRWEGARGNAADCTKDLWDIAIGAGVAGLVVGRLASMVIAGTNPLANLGDILIVRSGVDTGWAVLGALAALVLLSRDETLQVGAGVAAATLAGLGGWEAGCLVRDTCHGTATDAPWGIALSGSEVVRHPVGIYAALGFAVATLVVILVKRKTQHPLLVIGCALALAGAVRLVTEPFRSALGSRPTLWYWAALAVGGAIAAFLSLRSRRHRLSRLRKDGGSSS